MNPESLNSSTAGGRVLGSTEPAPLLVLAGCWGSRKITRTENKNQKEKPFTQTSLQNLVEPNAPPLPDPAHLMEERECGPALFALFAFLCG